MEQDLIEIRPFTPGFNVSMTVPVMNVRYVRMAVTDGFVPVRMGVGFAPVPGKVVLVPMMFVVHMVMRMGEDFMGVKVHMTLGEMQPDSGPHQQAR